MPVKHIPPASPYRRALSNTFKLINDNFINLDGRIDAVIEAGLPPYAFEKVSAVDISGTDDAGAIDVVTLTTPTLPAGTYELGYSFQVTFASKDKPVFFKLAGTFPDSLYFANGSSANNANHINRAYFYPKDYAGGIVTMTLKMYKTSGVTTADFADLFIRRVA